MTLIWIIVDIWFFGAVLYSFYCWWKKTDRTDAPMVRRFKALGYGAMWPRDLYDYYKAQDRPDRPGLGLTKGAGATNSTARLSTGVATQNGPARPATGGDTRNGGGARSGVGARLAGKAEQAVAKAEQVVTKAATSGKAAVEARADGAGPRLLDLIRMEDDRPVTIERLVVMLVDAVADDGDSRDLSDRDVYKAAKRRYRRLGTISLPAGPVGGYLVNLYCEAATLCDLVELRGERLADEVVAAHLLVLWRAMPDAPSAMAAIDGTGRSVVATLAARASQGARTRLPAKMTKLGVVTTLWNLRGVVGDARELSGTGLRANVFPGGRVREFIVAARSELDTELTLHS